MFDHVGMLHYICRSGSVRLAKKKVCKKKKTLLLLAPSRPHHHFESFCVPSRPPLSAFERSEKASLLLAKMQAISHSTRPRALSSLLIYLLILSTPYLLWQSLCAVSHTDSPIVVVTSESMEPVFQRGDVLFVSNRDSRLELGDIVVCWFEGRELPFVHRVIEKHALAVGTRGNSRYECRIHYLFLLRRDSLTEPNILASRYQAVKRTDI